MKFFMLLVAAILILLLISLIIYMVGYLSGYHKRRVPFMVGMFWSFGEPCVEPGCEEKSTGHIGTEPFCKVHLMEREIETPEGLEKVRDEIRKLIDPKQPRSNP